MLLEAGFFPRSGFPRVYLVSHFVGMLSILLHVDFNCIFILALLWVMWKQLYSLLPIFLTTPCHTYALIDAHIFMHNGGCVLSCHAYLLAPFIGILDAS